MASPANAPGPMLKAILLLTMIEPPLVAYRYLISGGDGDHYEMVREYQVPET